MGRKKIAFVNTNMHIGGIPKASIPFLEQLQKIYDVTLFLTDGEGELIGSVPKDVKIVILHNIPLLNKRRNAYFLLFFLISPRCRLLPLNKQAQNPTNRQLPSL